MSHQGPLRGPARLFEAVRRETVTELGGVLSGFWGTIEEQVRLEALAGHDYSGAQDDRMAVMALGHRALDLATRYRKSLEREFDAWREPPVERSADKSLSLMSEGELEIHLAGQHTTELLDHQFLHPLEQLDERMQALAAALGVEGKRPNPVRPEAAVAAFVDLFGAEDLTRGLHRAGGDGGADATPRHGAATVARPTLAHAGTRSVSARSSAEMFDRAAIRDPATVGSSALSGDTGLLAGRVLARAAGARGTA